MMSGFTSILGALNARLNVADAFPEIAAGFQQLSGCDRSSLALLDETGEWFCLTALHPPEEQIGDGIRFQLAESPASPAILDGRMHLVADLATERDLPLPGFLYAAGYRSYLSAPLRGYQGVCGSLNLSWRRVDGFAAVDLAVLSHAADAVALAVERSRLFEEVHAGRGRIQALSRRLLEVQEEERRHLARELHDEVGQLLTALKFSLDSAGRVPPPLMQARMREAQQHLDTLVARVRSLSLGLRPAVLDDLGLLPALLGLFERLGQLAGLRVRFEHGGISRRFPPLVETAAYRIVQEALTNVSRHAGVTEATVRIWADAGRLHLQITDAGRGFAPGSGTQTTGGRLGMRERATLLSGQLTIHSAPERGTRIHAQLPI